MAERGHPASDPNASREAVSARYRSMPHAAAWQIEQATAVSDAICSGRSGIVALAERLHRGYADRLFAQRVSDVESYRAMRARAVRLARELLSELTR